MEPIELSKLEVARRQLEAAINLYFADGDEVSIHTLAAASYNVIHDIVEKKKLGPMIVKDLVVKSSKPEMRTLLRQALNEAENFFKHADRDPEAILKFFPIQTEYLIFDAETRYQILTSTLPDVFLVFRG